MFPLRLGWLCSPALWGLGVLAVFGAGYWLGSREAPRMTGPQPQQGQLRWVQFDLQQPLEPAPDARELIPLQPGPGQGPGEECPLLIYQDGQLFRFELPGQPMPGPGMPNGSPELIPLEPSAPAPPSPPSRPGPSS